MTSQENSPELSVTVLNYNYGHFLPKCLDSILAQDFKDFEIILINDKSTDNSLEVIQPYLEDKRIRLIDHKENKGFVNSLIEGAELSRGKFITVISADDWIISPEAFRRQMSLLEQDSDIAFVYTAYGHFDNSENLNYIWRSTYSNYVRPGLDVFRDLIFNPFILHSGTIIAKSAYTTVGGYDSSYKYSVDAKMWLLLCHVGKVAYLNEPFYAYRRHGNNMSKNVNSLKRAISEVLSALELSYSMWSPAEQQGLKKYKDSAQGKILTAFVIDDIFQSHYKAGWYCYWVAFRLHPLKTFFQRTTLIILLRTILGRKGYSFLERIVGRFKAGTRQRLEIETMDKAAKLE